MRIKPFSLWRRLVWLFFPLRPRTKTKIEMTFYRLVLVTRVVLVGERASFFPLNPTPLILLDLRFVGNPRRNSCRSPEETSHIWTPSTTPRAALLWRRLAVVILVVLLFGGTRMRIRHRQLFNNTLYVLSSTSITPSSKLLPPTHSADAYTNTPHLIKIHTEIIFVRA